MVDEEDLTPDDITEEDPEIQQSFAGFIKSKPRLGTTRNGVAKFYAKVGQEHWRREEDGSFTKLKTTLHDLVAYRGAAVRAFENCEKGDYVVAHGRLEEYTSTRTGEVKKRFVTSKLGHDMARTRYEVDRTPRPSPAEREAPAFDSARSQDRQPPAPGL